MFCAVAEGAATLSSEFSITCTSEEFAVALLVAESFTWRMNLYDPVELEPDVVKAYERDVAPGIMEYADAPGAISNH